MRSFFKIFLASFLALVVFSVLAFFLFVGLIGAAMSSDKPETGDKAVLVVDLSVPFPEQSSESIASFLTGDGEGPKGLYDVVRLINHARTDANVKGIYLKATHNSNGHASSEELRRSLDAFRRAGKFVIAYGDYISQRAYHVATAADKIYINPQGWIDWTGYSMDMVFLKGLFDKLQIEPQVFYAGQFKSATEPFRSTEMSEPNRRQSAEFVEDLYRLLLQATAERRQVDTATLRRLAHTGAVRTAADAVRYKLVDGVKYDDQVKAEIRRWLKLSATGKINFVSVDRYAESVNYKSGKGSDRVALIYADGEIITGSEQEGMIASDQMKNLIRKAASDKNIKAIVLRVNSPGGSALASEVIWREVTEAKKIKPVVVSMGDYAASGGYYIACAADSVFAGAGTLTGSIGVFRIIPNLKGLFNDKLGITFDGVKTGPYADMGTGTRPMTESEKQWLQQETEQTYAVFKQRVAAGRRLSAADVENIAQGRIWSGQQALKVRLVDRIGTLDDAVQCAARMARLKEYRVREFPVQRSIREQLFGDTEKEVKENAIREELGLEQYQWYKQVRNLKYLFNQAQARLPFELRME